MNKFEKWLQDKSITIDEFKAKDVAAKAKLHTEYQETIVKDAVSELKIDELKASINGLKKDGATKEDIQKLEYILKKQGEDISEFARNKVEANTLSAGIAKFFKENKKELERLYSSGSGVVKFMIVDPKDKDADIQKAVGDLTTGSATTPDGIPVITGVMAAPPNNVNLRAYYIGDLVTQFNTNQAALPYSETVPKEGTPLYVAEGDAKPQIDLKIETRYAEPKRIAAWVRLTKDAIADIPRLESIARDYLKKQHDLKKQKEIINGDGAGENPQGITDIGRLFSAGGMALKVDTPNIMDVINACITDIAETHNYTDESAYMANIALMNPLDFFVYFKSAKDSQGRPLFPQAVLFNEFRMGELVIKPSRDIAQGYISVADVSKYNVTNYEPYNVTVGWVNDDFIKNQFVILAESRGHYYVKNLDKQAFIYDQIETIKTAIKKP